MAIITSSIGTAGRNYSTIQAWEDSLPASAVALNNSYVGECYNDSEFTSTASVVTFAGTTVDATRTVTLTAAAGQSFVDHATAATNPLFYDATKGVALLKTSNYGATISVGYDVIIRRLQVRAGLGGRVIADGGGITADQCILVASVSGSTDRAINVNGAMTLTNTLVISRNGDTIVRSVGNATVDSCTLVSLAGTPSYGVRSNYNTATVRNSLIYGAAATGTGGSAFSIVNSQSDVTSGTGWTQQTAASQFVSTTTDFRLKTGAPAIGAGSTTQTVDIIGKTRPSPPSVGACDIAGAVAILLAILEAAAASDGSSATVISAAAASEAGAATDASQPTKAALAAIAEVGAGADATAGICNTAATNVEVRAAADSISTGTTTLAAIAETGAAVDASSALRAGVAAVAEIGAATDSRSAVAVLGASTTDTLTAAEASSTSGAATGASTMEAGAAAETSSSTQQGIAATNEAAAASETSGAVMATTAGKSDALTAADLQQTGGTIISASVAESGAVADFVLASYMLAAQAIEGASASDWLASSFMGVASISENSPAIDITSGRWITSAAVTDALAALALTAAQLGGQLKPNPHRTYVGRARIRSITGATRIRSL